MKLSLLTPSGTKQYDKIDEIILPTTLGEIAVLPRHENLVAELAHGVIEVKSDGETDRFAGFGGFAKITGTEVKVFSAGVEHADSLDEAEPPPRGRKRLKKRPREIPNLPPRRRRSNESWPNLRQ